MPDKQTPPHPIFDAHVHAVGVGAGDSGCYFHERRRHSLPMRALRAANHIPRRQFDHDLEAVVRDRLTGWLDEMPELRVVVLALDQVHDRHGQPVPERTDFYVPNDHVFALADRHPRLLPACSVHPHRADAVNELERCAARGAVLCKWLPVSQGFSPEDEACRPFYRALVRLGMPLLCHTGSEGATREWNPETNDPAFLRSALEAGVTVIAAHAGMASLPFRRDYTDTWIAMLKEYPNLYGDTASWFWTRARRAPRRLGNPLVRERLLHGSDWPVPNSPWWFVGMLPLTTIWRLSRIRNPLRRDLQTKRALGVPEEVFERAGELLRLR